MATKYKLQDVVQLAGKDFFVDANELDFVDKAIVSLCKENNLVLLTNDKDFKNADLDILTANTSILG